MKKYMVFLYTGLLGSLIDIDHVFMLIKEGVPITFYNLEENGTRVLHMPIFYALAIYAIITIIIFVMSISKKE